MRSDDLVDWTWEKARSPQLTQFLLALLLLLLAVAVLSPSTPVWLLSFQLPNSLWFVGLWFLLALNLLARFLETWFYLGHCQKDIFALPADNTPSEITRLTKYISLSPTTQTPFEEKLIALLQKEFPLFQQNNGALVARRSLWVLWGSLGIHLGIILGILLFMICALSGILPHQHPLGYVAILWVFFFVITGLFLCFFPPFRRVGLRLVNQNQLEIVAESLHGLSWNFSEEFEVFCASIRSCLVDQR